jgi:ribonucleoside-diphosphate reductase alpha chain
LSIPTFTHSEALASATEYFNGDTLSASVWLNKYALKDSDGNIYEMNPDDMHLRIASEIARIEQKYPNPLTEEEIFDAIKGFKYIVPQGSPMAGIGNDYQVVTISNCFVISTDGESDSYGGIMRLDEEQVQLMKRRGGVGHDLSHLRPKGSPVKNSALTGTGVVPFMERYSNSTREVAQDGRRGALMLTLSSRHPDILDFIDAKTDLTKITGANISIKIDDALMQAVADDSKYLLQWPVGSKSPRVEKEIGAKDIWNRIVHNAWASAEPGVLFWDTIIRESVPDCYDTLGFKTVSTNPCSEIGLCGYDSCRLLAINLLSFVRDRFTDNAVFDFGLFAMYARMSQRIMDDIVDIELEKIDAILAKIDNDPEPESIKSVEKGLWVKIREKCQQGRRTGIGITGEGDMLAALGLRYGSPESLDFCESVHKILAQEVYWGSIQLAKERGAFPIYDFEREKNNPFINRLFASDEIMQDAMQKYGRRNIALLTVAPTGTVSLMTQTSSGLEPVFRIAYKRRKKVNPGDKSTRVDFVDGVGDSWEEYYVFHHAFKEWMSVKGYNVTEMEHLTEGDLNALIEKSPWYGATADDVDWLAKVHLQGRVQKWVDHSISVTVNLPETATEELISEIYRTGWKVGCKGMTVYRDGSRSGVLVSNTPSPEKESFKENHAPKRPKSIDATVVTFMNNHERWIAVLGVLEGHPYEIFTGKAEDEFASLVKVTEGKIVKNREDGKSRYDFQYEVDGETATIEGLSRTFDEEYWNYAKLISGILRHGMPLHYVVNVVENLRFGTDSLNTWKKGVLRALRKFVPDGTVDTKNICPTCQSPSLVYEEGCLHCNNCGHSECS